MKSQVIVKVSTKPDYFPFTYLFYDKQWKLRGRCKNYKQNVLQMWAENSMFRGRGSDGSDTWSSVILKTPLDSLHELSAF